MWYTILFSDGTPSNGEENKTISFRYEAATLIHKAKLTVQCRCHMQHMLDLLFAPDSTHQIWSDLAQGPSPACSAYGMWGQDTSTQQTR